MTQTHDDIRPSLLHEAGISYFLIAFIARLPFAMMVVGVLTIVVSARGSISQGGLASAFVGIGTACCGPLLGAAADRFGQRIVLLILAVANGAMILVFAAVSYAQTPDALLYLAAIGIGATAPQVSPMSRARLVTIISERIPQRARAQILSGTMAYESAADETVFVFGPFLVGILASGIGPWAPLVIASLLIWVFVGAFALHPTGRLTSAGRAADGTAPSPVSALFRPRLLVVVLGILGVGVFFGGMLTSLTSFMGDRGASEQAGLLYGVMGVGSAALALGVAWLPQRFALAARWLVFSGILLGGTLLLGFVHDPGGMMGALAIMGIGIGPTLVTLYSLGAQRSPQGRSATVMTMLGSGVVVGQSLGAAITGELAENAGTAAALTVPLVAAAIAVAAGLLNLLLGFSRARTDR